MKYFVYIRDKHTNITEDFNTFESKEEVKKALEMLAKFYRISTEPLFCNNWYILENNNLKIVAMPKLED